VERAPGPHRRTQVDIRPEGFGGNRNPDQVLLGDVALVLEQLAEAWPSTPTDRSEWLAEATSLTDWVRSTWDEQIAAHNGKEIHAGAATRDLVAWAP
jgi:thiamine pyrophosphate-dependent acetolactate synthase large subunit-like protein